MSRLQISIVALAAVLCAAGCGPTVTVMNNTRIPVRAFVSASGGENDTLSPSPGESSVAEVSEGAFQVKVVPDTAWVDYAKTSRKLLNDQLANSDNLSGPQLLDVVKRLKDVAAQMQQMESVASAGGASCAGTISSDGAALVNVSVGASGALAVSC
jgi:hypothetical protein